MVSFDPDEIDRLLAAADSVPAEQVDEYRESFPQDTSQIEPAERLQRCVVCEREYALTNRYWHLDSNTDTGFKTICKECRKTVNNEELAKDVQRMVTDIDAGALALLNSMIRSDARTRSSRIPHANELYEALMGAFGGTLGFAHHCMANYLASKPGSTVRSRMITQIINLGLECTKAGATSKAVSELTDEELEKEMAEALESSVQATVFRLFPGSVVDGTATPTPPQDAEPHANAS